MKMYPVVESLNGHEKKALGVTKGTALTSLGVPVQNVMAVPTGEKRPPKKGEWFLSGVDVEAYRAYADMTVPYHIATLVRVEEVTTLKIVARV